MMEQEAILRIGALARLSGVSPDALRFYERLGLIAPLGRTSGRYRLFGQNAVERVQFVRKAQRLGLTLSDIRGILDVAVGHRQPCSHVRDALERRLHSVDGQIAELRSLRLTLANALSLADQRSAGDACVCGIIEAVPLPIVRKRRHQSRGNKEVS